MENKLSIDSYQENAIYITMKNNFTSTRMAILKDRKDKCQGYRETGTLRHHCNPVVALEKLASFMKCETYNSYMT